MRVFEACMAEPTRSRRRSPRPAPTRRERSRPTGCAPDWRRRRRRRADDDAAPAASARAPYDIMNLGAAVGDDAGGGRARTGRCSREAIGAAPVFLRQVHGARVVRLGAADAAPGAPIHAADAASPPQPASPASSRSADCLPVLLAAPDGRAVGAAHAGWRGLAAGVVEAAVEALCEAAGCAPGDVAGLARCLHRPGRVRGRRRRARRVRRRRRGSQGRSAALPAERRRQVAADLPRWRAIACAAAGVAQISGGAWCTVADAVTVLLVPPRRRHRPHGRRGLDRRALTPRRGDARRAATACRPGTARSNPAPARTARR